MTVAFARLGIRLHQEAHRMAWAEFVLLLQGMLSDPDEPLSRVFAPKDEGVTSDG